MAHVHLPARFDRVFAIGVGLNLAFVLLEAIAGFSAGSLALLADAGHNLSDVVGLLLAWGAAVLVRRHPTRTHTYGLRRTSVLAAMVNATVLLVAVGGLGFEAFRRVLTPAPVAGLTVMAVAALPNGLFYEKCYRFDTQRYVATEGLIWPQSKTSWRGIARRVAESVEFGAQ